MQVRTRRLTLAVAPASALLTSLLLSGCHDAGPSAPTAPQNSAAQRDRTMPVSGLAQGEPVAVGITGQQRRNEQRVARLQRELAGARAQRTHLLQTQEEISARLAAHQEEGMQLLASLKAQHQPTAAGRDAFAANARAELEAALAQDQNLTAELESAYKELSHVEARIDTLATEIASLIDSSRSARHESSFPAN